jgi:hypothetical protein
MLNKLKNNFFQKGAAQLPIIIGLLLLGVALPAALKLVQESQETRKSATNQLCCCTGITAYTGGTCFFYEGTTCPIGTTKVSNEVCEGGPTIALSTNTPTNTPTLGDCNAACEEDANCQDGLVCYEVGMQGLEVCRNLDCPLDDDCDCSVPTNTPTNTPTSTPTNTPTNTPTLGDCNAACEEDANCQDGLVCYEVGMQGLEVCRNSQCPEDDNCDCQMPTNTLMPTSTPPQEEGCKPCPDGSSTEEVADYDCDGDVDMQDFAAWYDDYSLNSDNLYGDFNCSGDLDSGDVSRWYIQLPKFD